MSSKAKPSQAKSKAKKVTAKKPAVARVQSTVNLPKQKSFRLAAMSDTSFDPRVAYGSLAILWGFAVFLVGSRAIDTASMWVYGLLFVSLYFFMNDTYKFVKAVKNKEHKIHPSGKRNKA